MKANCHAFLLLSMTIQVMVTVAVDKSQDATAREEKTTNDMDALADKIINDYYPYKWIAPYMLKNEKDGSPSDEEQNKHARQVEKWLLIGFCTVCILAMIICIIVLIAYRVKKKNAEEQN